MNKIDLINYMSNTNVNQEALANLLLAFADTLVDFADHDHVDFLEFQQFCANQVGFTSESFDSSMQIASPFLVAWRDGITNKKPKLNEEPQDQLGELSSLPIELISAIIHYLDLKSKLHLMQSSKAFFRLGNDFSFWRNEFDFNGLNPQIVKRIQAGDLISNNQKLYRLFSQMNHPDKKALHAWEIVCMAGTSSDLAEAINSNLFKITDKNSTIENCLFVACRFGNLEAVQYFVTNLHMNPAKKLLTTYTEILERYNALHYAAICGQFKVMQYLMTIVDPRALTTQSYNLLHMAAIGGDVKCIELALTQSKVDINSVVKDNGLSALHLVCKYRHVEALKYLLENGASTTIKSSVGFAPRDYVSINATFIEKEKMYKVFDDVALAKRNLPGNR